MKKKYIGVSLQIVQISTFDVLGASAVTEEGIDGGKEWGEVIW